MGIFFFLLAFFSHLSLRAAASACFPRLDWPLGQLSDAASSHTLTVSVARHCKPRLRPHRWCLLFLSFGLGGGGTSLKKEKNSLV